MLATTHHAFKTPAQWTRLARPFFTTTAAADINSLRQQSHWKWTRQKQSFHAFGPQVQKPLNRHLHTQQQHQQQNQQRRQHPPSHPPPRHHHRPSSSPPLPSSRRDAPERQIPSLSRYFLVFYTPVHITPLAAQSILDAPQHPRYIATRRHYAARPRDCLWWLVKAPVSVSPKRVVRSWAQRRVRQAFVEVMGLRGLDGEGRVVIGGGNGNGNGSGRSGGDITGTAGGATATTAARVVKGNKELGVAMANPKVGLSGSLRFQVLESLLTAKKFDIVADLERVVDKLFQLQLMNANGGGKRGQGKREGKGHRDEWTLRA